jgi:NAD(P)H-dependent flavin oxidoreductase YrpB (nitropropane dioxygenase family)
MDFRDRLGLEHPLMQAALGGGLATAALAGAVSRAGGLGMVGMLSPNGLAREIGRAKALAPRGSLGAGLLVPFLQRAHVQACVSANVDAVVLFYGFAPWAVRELHDAGIFVLHQVGTAEQTRRAIAEGADAIVAQGREAGGHLLGERPAHVLFPEVLEAASGKPVLLAGGIAAAMDVRKAMAASASGVVVGTRFLLTTECRAHSGYKARVLGARRTLETELFGLGWPAPHRVVPNAATERWCDATGGIPSWVRTLHRVSAALGRVASVNSAALLSRIQRIAIPLFGPSAALQGADERVLDVTPLYAGECAARIGAVVSAEEAVKELMGA